MNIKRMHKVLAAMKDSHKKELFDMATFGPMLGQSVQDCGTRGCIAGHAAWLFLTLKERERLTHLYPSIDIGAALLDLPYDVAHKLFMPNSPRDYTYKAAVTAMTKLIKRGEKVGSYDGNIQLPKRKRA